MEREVDNFLKKSFAKGYMLIHVTEDDNIQFSWYNPNNDDAITAAIVSLKQALSTYDDTGEDFNSSIN